MKFHSLVLGAVISVAAVTRGAGFTPGIPQRAVLSISLQLNMAYDGQSDSTTNAATSGPPKESPVKTETKAKEDSFVNDGLFSWMETFLFPYGEGKSLSYGVPVSAHDKPKATPDQVAAQKQEYTKNMMNIGTEERERRRNAADFFAVATAAYLCWAALIADQGDMAGHIVRFISVLPLFVTVGYKESGQRGL